MVVAAKYGKSGVGEVKMLPKKDVAQVKLASTFLENVFRQSQDDFGQLKYWVRLSKSKHICPPTPV